MTHYIHLRKPNPHYPNQPQPRGGYTIEYENDKKTQDIFFVIAKCSQQDTFNKIEGRKVCNEYFKQNNKINVCPKLPYHTSKQSILIYLNLESKQWWKPNRYGKQNQTTTNRKQTNSVSNNETSKNTTNNNLIKPEEC